MRISDWSSDVCSSDLKRLRAVRGAALGAAIDGYEMHMGESHGSRLARPFATLEDGPTDGAISSSGTVMGSYLHGLFASADLRRALLDRIVLSPSGRDYPAVVATALHHAAVALPPP